MEGGPLFTLQKRVGLIKDEAPYLKRRAAVAALATWLPLLILAAMQGLAFGYTVPVPFLRDFSTYTRFLLAIPLLLLAENILGPRIADAAAHFVTSGVIQKKDFQRFDNLVNRGLRARDSVTAEVIIVALAYMLIVGLLSGDPEPYLHLVQKYFGGRRESYVGWVLVGRFLHAALSISRSALALEIVSLVSVSRPGLQTGSASLSHAPGRSCGTRFCRRGTALLRDDSLRILARQRRRAGKRDCL